MVGPSIAWLENDIIIPKRKKATSAANDFYFRRCSGVFFFKIVQEGLECDLNLIFKETTSKETNLLFFEGPLTGTGHMWDQCGIWSCLPHEIYFRRTSAKNSDQEAAASIEDFDGFPIRI